MRISRGSLMIMKGLLQQGLYILQGTATNDVAAIGESSTDQIE